jgi:hypothetical protein
VIGGPHQPAAVGRPDDLDAGGDTEGVDERRRRRARHLGERGRRREPQELPPLALGARHTHGVGVQRGLHHLVTGHEGLEDQPAAALLATHQARRPRHQADR